MKGERFVFENGMWEMVKVVGRVEEFGGNRVERWGGNGVVGE